MLNMRITSHINPLPNWSIGANGVLRIANILVHKYELSVCKLIVLNRMFYHLFLIERESDIQCVRNRDSIRIVH